MKKNDTRSRRRARRFVACLAALLCGGCQFLQNEFSVLDCSPPSVHARPRPQPW